LKVIIRKIIGDFSSITVPRISKAVVKYARVGFVIGLVVSIGTASAIARATAIDFNSRIAKVSVGADINIEAYSMNIDTLDNLTKITGVNNFTYIFSAPADEFIFGTIYMRVVFINPKKYLEIAKRYIEEDYTRNGMFKALVEMEKNKSYVLINERASIETPASIGDNITLWVSVNNMVSKFNCHVLDLIDALPGFSELSHKRYTDYPVRGSYYIQEPYIVINKALIEDYINEYNISLTEMIDSRVKILVDVEEGYNQTRVAEKISQQYDVIKITTAEEAINKANINPTVLSDVEYLWLEYQIMLLIATLGIVVSMISIVESRKREFGMLVARGATTQQLIKLMLSEFLAILLITIPIGVLTGIPSVYAVLPQIQFLQTTTTVPIKLTITQDFIYVAILSALSIIAGILGAVYTIEKEKVVEVIRFE
ncbi:MAG: FtsX-like permease family protein, partial [Candidatus Odinarchaeota archaeon]|nr:FtsX-like permease family protein [Candidatus Odinarchaeota archaeon]